MNNHEINAKRRWSFDSVRAACIRNHLYTGGTWNQFQYNTKMPQKQGNQEGGNDYGNSQA